jgi:hypothetical protein
MGKFIWPGSGVTFLLFLLLHANYFGHPLLITCFDSFFNALLYTGIAATLRRLLQWVAKTVWTLFSMVARRIKVERCRWPTVEFAGFSPIRE